MAEDDGGAYGGCCAAASGQPLQGSAAGASEMLSGVWCPADGSHAQADPLWRMMGSNCQAGAAGPTSCCAICGVWQKAHVLKHAPMQYMVEGPCKARQRPCEVLCIMWFQAAVQPSTEDGWGHCRAGQQRLFYMHHNVIKVAVDIACLAK